MGGVTLASLLEQQPFDQAPPPQAPQKCTHWWSVDHFVRRFEQKFSETSKTKTREMDDVWKTSRESRAAEHRPRRTIDKEAEARERAPLRQLPKTRLLIDRISDLAGIIVRTTASSSETAASSSETAAASSSSIPSETAASSSETAAEPILTLALDDDDGDGDDH